MSKTANAKKNKVAPWPWVSLPTGILSGEGEDAHMVVQMKSEIDKEFLIEARKVYNETGLRPAEMASEYIKLKGEKA